MLLFPLTCAAVAKTGPVLHSPKAVAAARQKIVQFDWAKKQRDDAVVAAAKWLPMTDQEIWDFVPPAEQRRALNVSFGVGCPVHGTEVFRAGGHYPWKFDPERPFKVICPVGGEAYPENDFEPWHPGDQPPEKGAKIVDHGTGWVDAQGRRYWFVAHYIFWQRWQREVLPGIRNLGNAWLLTGDPVYAHKAAVLLARIATEYDRYDYHTQAYHNGQYPNHYNGRIIDHIWMNGVVSSAAETYDAIFETLAGDDGLTAFLAAKGVNQPARYLEQKLLGQMARDLMDGIIRGNMGMHQQAMATVAAVLQNDDPDYAPTTAQMRDWLLYGGGELEDLLWNGWYRDGHGGESSPGYSAGWNLNFYTVAERLPLIGYDVWSNPKTKKMADVLLDLAVNGRHTPDIGDSGSILGSGRVGWAARLFRAAFEQYGEPRYAQAMAMIGGGDETLWDRDISADVGKALAEHGETMSFRTRHLPGYGLAILEGGSTEHPRGLSLYYGNAAGGHGHRDRLNLELWAFDRPVLTDMGYPAHWLAKNTYWTSNTISHYGVTVDEQGQRTLYGGNLVCLASADRVQFVEAEADRVAYPGTAERYRRASALIDLDDEHGYLVDIFRVKGGRTHDWSFHGPPFAEFSTTGLAFTPPAAGTLAGESVAFGAKLAGKQIDGGGTVITPADLKPVLDDPRPYAERSQEGWAAYASGSMLTRAPGSRVAATLDQPLSGTVYLRLHAYDYNAGVNEVEVDLGGRKQTVKYGESGQVGYLWTEPIEVALTAPVTEVGLTAKVQGQNYILLDALAISPTLEPPVVRDLANSGFQYLRSPQYANPAAGWTANWREPEGDLRLTLTVPDGVADRVVLADAEPELKPNHPDHMPYLIAHREAAEGESLASTFIAVVEPHQGEAAVRSVRRLTLRSGPDQAVALAIERTGGTDFVYSSPEPEADAVAVWLDGRELACHGRFVRAVMVDGQPTQVTCIDGGAVAGQAGPPTLAASVSEVDIAANTITVDRAWPEPESLVGQVVIYGNDRHSSSAAVVTATNVDGHTVLGFGDVLLVVGTGNVTSLEDGKVLTDTRLGGGARVDGGQHQGRRLLNEAQAMGPRIASLPGNGFVLDPFGQPLADFYTDADGDGRTRFWIADVGPGDWVRLPRAATR